MEYTKGMGLVSKSLLKEIADAIRKQSHTTSNILVKDFATKLNSIKPAFRVGGVIVQEDNDLNINNAEQQKAFNGFKMTITISEA